MPIFQTKNGDAKQAVNVIQQGWTDGPQTSSSDSTAQFRKGRLFCPEIPEERENRFKDKSTCGGEGTIWEEVDASS